MFTVEAIKTLKNSGTVAPSSKFLVNKMIEPINYKNKVIVEFGTGNGCITKGILKKTGDHAKIFSFELNSKFYDVARKEMNADNRLHLINESAVACKRVLTAEGINCVDYVISSLPLTLLKDSDINSILKKVKELLASDGMFIQFQYSLHNYRLLRDNFSEVRLGFTLINIPPAFIYYCKP